MNCHVKDGSRIYEGTVVTFGSKDDVQSVEEQFLCGFYTPDFWEESEEEETKNDEIKDKENKPPKKKLKLAKAAKDR